MKKNKTLKMLLIVMIFAVIACTTLVACEEKVTVTFMDGENVLETVEIEKDSAITLPTNPTKGGYSFVGWYVDKELTQAYDAEVVTSVSANVTLYAKFEKIKLYVSVVTNGGTVIIDGQEQTERGVVEVSNGATYTLPTPTKAGYTFLGYTLDGEDFAISGTYERENSITVRAQWALNTYVVSYFDGSNKLADANVNHGSKVVYSGAGSSLIKTGYTFAGWYTDAELTNAYDENTLVTGNFNLYAKFNANSYVINVNANGGDAVNAVNVVYGGEYTLPTPTRTGYTFAGYTLDGEDFALSGTYDKVTNVTVRAQWTLNSYVVTIDGDEQNVNHGGKVVLPTAPVGHTFAGLYTDAEFNTAFDANTEVTSNLTLYAKYTANAYVINVVLVRNDATLVGGTTINVTYGASYEVADPTTTNANYEFVKYTYGGVEFNQEGTYNYATDITIVAEWTTVEGYYNLDVVFMNGNQTVASFEIERADDTAVVIDPTLIPEDPTKVGYTFSHWALTENGVAEDLTVAISTSKVYHACYTVNVYTINFAEELTDAYYANGIEVTYGAGYSITAPVKVGYQFMGWVIEDTEDAFNASGLYVTEGDVTLAPVWNINTYEVEVFVDGELVDTMVIDYGDVITVPTISANEGHTLDGWYTNSACTTEYDFATLVTKEFSIYAKNVANKYTITVNASNVEVVNAIAPIEVTYGQPYSVGDLVATNANYVFNGYTLDGNEFAQSGTYTYATNIEIVAVWQAEDVSSDLFVADEANGYFKERDSVNDLFTYVFLVGNTYNFNVESIVFPDGIPSVYVSQTELYGTSFTALKAGEFTMTVNKADAEPVVYDVKVVDKVNYFSAGTDYNNAWGASYNRSSFRNTEKGTLNVGTENFIPDLVARDVNSNSISYANINVDLLSAVDSEMNDISASVSEVDGVFTLDSTLVGKTITLAFRPRYTFIDDTVSMTFNVNAGVNVYDNLGLKKAYSDLTVREINVLRNVKAELSAIDYVNNDPNTGAPKNADNYDRGYEHGVYTRLATTAGDVLKINGNFFTVDGTDLPYINNALDGGDGNEQWKIIGNNYVVAFVQVGMFLYYSAPTAVEACPNGTHVDNNSDHYCDTCNKSMMRMRRDYKYQNSTLTIDNLNVKGNYDTARSTETKKVKDPNGNEGDLITMSASMLGIVNRGGTINMNNVSVSNALSATFSDSPASTNDGEHDVQWYLNDCILKDSWHANAYVFGLTKIVAKNTYFGSCNGGSLHFDDRPWDNAAWTNQFNSVLNVDANCVFENYITGEEAWFVAYGQSTTATTLKVALGSVVDQVDAGVNAQLNSQYGTSGVTYVDKTLIHPKKTGIGEGATTVDTLNFVMVVRSSAYDDGDSVDWSYEGAGDTAYDASGMPMIEHNFPVYFAITSTGIDMASINPANNYIPFIEPSTIDASTDFNKIMSGIVLGRDANA